MTIEELNQVYDQLRSEGRTDEEILGMLYLMYMDEQINTNELEAMIEVLGYEFSPEFAAMSEEDKHIKGFSYIEAEEDK